MDDGVLRGDTADKTVCDLLSEDVEDKFSRQVVNVGFRTGKHRELMHQQLM